MNFFVEMVYSLIFLTFPIFVYCYFAGLNTKKLATIFLKISLLSSVLLFLISVDNPYLLIFINIPLFISYMKKYLDIYFLLNLLVMVALIFKFDISLYFVLLEYFSLFLVLKFSKSKLNSFTVVNAYFYSFYIYYQSNLSLNNNLLVNTIVMIFLFHILLLSIKYMIFGAKNKYLELEETYRSYLFKFIHEVKNPIAVCKGYIEMIEKGNNNSKKDLKKYVKIVNSEIDESLNLMEDYLMFGRFAVDLDYMDINLLLEDIYNNFKGLTSDNDINIEFDYDEEEVIILGDYNKLKQVLTNIIKNSIEAKKDDEVLNIKIKLSRDEDNIKIEVLDDGIGIKDIKKIGREFYTTKVNGTGLGVNFSKTIISMHKGKISYKSKYGMGTKVLIMLPLADI